MKTSAAICLFCLVSTTVSADSDDALAEAGNGDCHAEHPIPDELAVVVLREAAKESGRGRLCVSIDHADPSDEVMAILDLPEDLVIPGSACKRVGRPEHRTVVETKNGRPAQFLELSAYHPAQAGRGNISIRYSAGDWRGYGRAIEVYFEDGQWRIGAELGWTIE